MSIAEKIKKLISIIVVVNILAVIGYLYFKGCPQNPLNLISYNATLAFLSISISILINYYLWKIPFVNKLLGSIPDINGVWSAEIINTNEPIGEFFKLDDVSTLPMLTKENLIEIISVFVLVILIIFIIVYFVKMNKKRIKGCNQKFF